MVCMYYYVCIWSLHILFPWKSEGFWCFCFIIKWCMFNLVIFFPKTHSSNVLYLQLHWKVSTDSYKHTMSYSRRLRVGLGAAGTPCARLGAAGTSCARLGAAGTACAGLGPPAPDWEPLGPPVPDSSPSHSSCSWPDGRGVAALLLPSTCKTCLVHFSVIFLHMEWIHLSYLSFLFLAMNNGSITTFDTEKRGSHLRVVNLVLFSVCFCWQ